MSYTKITSRVAAAVLAGALALGALVGAGAVAASDHQVDAPVEETAATWSFTISPDEKGGGFTTSRATWS